jgi:hypothetical protein
VRIPRRCGWSVGIGARDEQRRETAVAKLGLQSGRRRIAQR